jgi:hypothetical protein
MATREHACYVVIECFDNEDGLLKLLGAVKIICVLCVRGLT